MNLRHRSVIITVVVSLALVACGGGDEPAAEVTTPPTVADGPPGTTEFGETVPTIAPDLPAEFLPGVGPVSVVGEQLPGYQGEGVTDEAIGMTAPVLLGETTDGAPIRIDATVDGPTWVVFLAHWCPHCNREIPVINQMRDDGRIPDGVNVVGVSTAYSPDRPNWPPDQWLEDKDWTYPAVNDGIDTVEQTYIAASGFGIGGFPFSMLVDGDGRVTARWDGERSPDELEALLTENLTL